MELRILLAALAAAGLAPVPPASAATGALDTATPVYQTVSAATLSNRFECSGGSCLFAVTTRTTAYPCSTETVVLASGLPALLYRDTYCQVSIEGMFDITGDQSEPCVLYALQSLTVRFTSGANSLFNGAFDVSGFFKPTGFSADGQYIRQAQVTVKGTDRLDPPNVGTGTIGGATFTVRFPGSGLPRSLCYAQATGANAGYVAAVTSAGTVRIAL